MQSNNIVIRSTVETVESPSTAQFSLVNNNNLTVYSCMLLCILFPWDMPLKLLLVLREIWLRYCVRFFSTQIRFVIVGNMLGISHSQTNVKIPACYINTRWEGQYKLASHVRFLFTSISKWDQMITKFYVEILWLPILW